MGILLRLLRDLLAQQAIGPEHDHNDQDEEGHHVLVLGAEGAHGVGAEVGAREALDHAEHHSAQQGAGQVPDATQHGGGEGLDAWHEPHERIDAGEFECIQDTGGTTQ